MEFKKGSKENLLPDNGLREAGYFELFFTFFKLGLFTIGGGMAMVPLMQDLIVNKKEWLSDDEIVDCIAVSQGLPGVIAINMATYIGFRKKSLLGAVCATVGVILPSLIVIILIVEGLKEIDNNRYVKGALTGIRACATGLIAYSAYKVGRQVLKDVFSVVIGVIAFALIGLGNINAVYVILAGIVIGIVYEKFRGRKKL